MTYHLAGNDTGPSTYGPNGFGDRGGDDGVLAMGWGSGTADFPYLITPLEAIQNRARKGTTSSERALVNWWMSDWDLAGAAGAVAGQDAAVGLFSMSGEIQGADIVNTDCVRQC